ncbi:unnamed protein product [Fusarium fujikuroi]|nr:unnamed protein product [Fusarium fujikuroi]
MAFIGCGNMGSSLLHGLLDAIFLGDAQNRTPHKVSKFIACTNSEESAKTLENILVGHVSRVSAPYRPNSEVMKQADVIILGFKPSMAKKILDDPEVRHNVCGKLVIRLIAGLSVPGIRDYISGSGKLLSLPEFWVAKAIPNLAARYRQFMAILEQPTDQIPSPYHGFLEWMFNLNGHVKFLDDPLVDVGSVLVTNCLTSLTVPLDGVLDGSVIEGFRRKDSVNLIAQSVVGLGSLLSHGNHPAILREQISSPRGCTINTLVAVERGAARVTFTDALI